MIRNLLFILLILALYQLWKGLSFTGKRKNIPHHNDLKQIDDEMVRDPFCQVYIPKSGATMSRIAGQDYYFCSPSCAKKFKEQN